VRFQFIDSNPGQACPAAAKKRIPSLLCAVDRLNRAVENGAVEVLTLSGKKRYIVPELPSVITYAVTGQSTIASWDVIADARFDVSHFVGIYSTKIDGKVVTIEIKPRWGGAILGYLLQYTTGIFMPPDAASEMDVARGSAEWLLVLLWKSMFNQALRRSHIPKEYRATRTNSRFFKGRLDVQRQIRENTADQSKFCCVHAPLTVDTTINRTIRHVVRLLSRNNGYAILMSDFASYDQRLASLGVEQCEVSPAEIDRIRYTRMSNGYRQLMQTSKAVIQRFGAGSSESLRDDTSFFIDIAEIWENYLQAILTKHLPKDYRVFSPNEQGGEWLIANSKREIRPDIIISKKNHVVAILDAKYKAVRSIGKTAREGVSREDLYQMTSYLYHYGKAGVPLLCLFISPSPGALIAQADSMTAERRHHMGVLNFDLSQFDNPNAPWDTRAKLIDIVAIQQREKDFAGAVRKLLEQLEAS